MQFLLDLLWYFVIFSFFGWVASSFRSLLLEKKFSNNGFLTSPFCPMYGFSAVICYTALKPFENSKLILFIGSTLILSALMVVVGVLVEKNSQIQAMGFFFVEIQHRQLYNFSLCTFPRIARYAACRIDNSGASHSR